MRQYPPYSVRRRAFTLIELLTVVAIIGILAAILIPTVGRVRESAYVAKTMSNLRQLYNGNRMHAADHKGLYVPTIALSLPGNGTNPAQWYNNPIFGRYVDQEKLDGWNRKNLVLHTGRSGANGGKAGPSLAPSLGANAYPRNFSLHAPEVDRTAPHMILFGDASSYWISGDGTMPDTNVAPWPDDDRAGTGGLAFRYSGKATVVLADGMVTRLDKDEATNAANLRRYFPATGDSSTDTRLRRVPPPY